MECLKSIKSKIANNKYVKNVQLDLYEVPLYVGVLYTGKL